MSIFNVYLVKAMKRNSCVNAIEVKKANMLHHNIEAGFFERAHPESSSVYERAQVSKSLDYVVENSAVSYLCVDVGCGTGFVTGFELLFYRNVVAADISRRMLEVARKRLARNGALHLVLCDAEHLPLKSEIADLVSVSSVLHHLPTPFSSIAEISRIVKRNGFLYITREPSSLRFRRFFDFFDRFFVQKFSKLVKPFFSGSEFRESCASVDGLDYAAADVHYDTGFHLAQLLEVLVSNCYEVVSAYSYHWIYSDWDGNWWHELLARSNFVLERIPFSNRFGRYLSAIAKRTGSF